MPRASQDKPKDKSTPTRASNARPRRNKPAAQPSKSPEHHDTLAGTGMDQEPTR
jgi:hypothetical protein